MNSVPDVGAAPENKPVWKNPFVLAFVIGAVLLTVLPFLQRRFLKAPPPISTLPSWQLSSLDGDVVKSSDLLGHVLLVNFVGDGCDDACVARFESFSSARGHLDDLKGSVHMLSIVWPSATAIISTHRSVKAPEWHVVSGNTEQVSALLSAYRSGWVSWAGTDAGATIEDFSRLPAFAVVDQNNALRGFWRDDVAGKGNAINAARLLAQHGVQP